jgi:hypothetical protein
VEAIFVDVALEAGVAGACRDQPIVGVHREPSQRPPACADQM